MNAMVLFLRAAGAAGHDAAAAGDAMRELDPQSRGR